MRPIDLQPAILQTPSVERTGQQQVANPQTAQQAFAAELQRRASERPAQVQAPEAPEGPKSGEVKPEEHGERRARRQPRRRSAPGTASADATVAEQPAADAPDPGKPGARVDIRA